MRKWAMSCAMGCAVVLAGCGGGSDGGGGDAAWLQITPKPATFTMYQGESPHLRLDFKATQTVSGIVNVGAVFDQAPDLQPTFDLYQQSQLEYVAVIPIVTTLAVGTHSGTLVVRLCHDDPSTCADPVSGSPWHVPYTVTVLAAPPETTVVANGDFSDGTTGWDTFGMEGGGVSIASADGALVATVTGAGVAPYDVQVKDVAGGLNLQSGKTYHLQFDAKAAAARTMQVTVWANGRDMGGYGSAWYAYLFNPGDGSNKTVNLTTAMDTYGFDFTMSETNCNASVAFFLGLETDAVTIDNVSLTEVVP